MNDGSNIRSKIDKTKDDFSQYKTRFNNLKKKATDELSAYKMKVKNALFGNLPEEQKTVENYNSELEENMKYIKETLYNAKNPIDLYSPNGLITNLNPETLVGTPNKVANDYRENISEFTENLYTRLENFGMGDTLVPYALAEA